MNVDTHDTWDLDIQDAQLAVQAPGSGRYQIPVPAGNAVPVEYPGLQGEYTAVPGQYVLRPDGGYQRSVTMTIAFDNGENVLESGGTAFSVPLMVSAAVAAGLILLVVVVLGLFWRKRVMKKRSSEKVYRLKQEEKDPWTDGPSSKSSSCLKLCTESLRGTALPTFYQQHSEGAPLPRKHQQQQLVRAQAQQPGTVPDSSHRQWRQQRHTTAARQNVSQPPAPPPVRMKDHIPPPLPHSTEASADGETSPRHTHRWPGDNVVYISGYSPTLQRRRIVGSDWESASSEEASSSVQDDSACNRTPPVDASASYRTLPNSRARRLQQFYEGGASTTELGPLGPCAAICETGAGAVSPDRVDMMLLDEEMRTRSLPSWMRNKHKSRLQDSSQHPINFALHKQRNRMDNDAASVIARARSQYPSRSSQEPHVVYDVRTAL